MSTERATDRTSPAGDPIRGGDQKRPAKVIIEALNGILEAAIIGRNIWIQQEGDRTLMYGPRAAQELADWLSSAATWLRATNGEANGD